MIEELELNFISNSHEVTATLTPQTQILLRNCIIARASGSQMLYYRKLRRLPCVIIYSASTPIVPITLHVCCKKCFLIVGHRILGIGASTTGVTNQGNCKFLHRQIYQVKVITNPIVNLMYWKKVYHGTASSIIFSRFQDSSTTVVQNEPEACEAITHSIHTLTRFNEIAPNWISPLSNKLKQFL